MIRKAGVRDAARYYPYYLQLPPQVDEDIVAATTYTINMQGFLGNVAKYLVFITNLLVCVRELTTVY